MSPSVKQWVKEAESQSEAVIIHLADVAFISENVINELIRRYKENRPKIAVVSYKTGLIIQLFSIKLCLMEF